LTPITRPLPSSSGPPELPGLIAASVWIALAGRDRPLQAERRSDRDRLVARFERVGVAQLERLQAAFDGARIDLQHGEVARRVLAHQLGRDRLRVDADPDQEGAGALDHVVIGDDVAFVVVDEAGAGAGLAGLDEDDAGGDALVELGDVRCARGDRVVLGLRDGRRRRRGRRRGGRGRCVVVDHACKGEHADHQAD
jgi:hypothetical protein